MTTQQSQPTTASGDLHFHWFLPTYGDSRNLVAGGHGTFMSGDRPATLPYLRQIVAAAEHNGFESLLTPTGAWCEDALLTSALLAESSERIKFLVALRPGLMSPTLAAQMATTFQWQTHGRLLLNVVTGGESAEQRAYGDFLDKEARYARADEFLEVTRRLWGSPGPVTFSGEHLAVENAVLGRRPEVSPPIFFGGSSAAGIRVAARHADTYLTWGEPPAAVAEKLDRVRSAAAEQGRELDYGIRLHVISRDTSEQAWAEAERLLARIDPADVDRVQASLASSESEGQRRMLELHGGRTDSLEIYPNLWAGVGLVRGGAGTALVGSHEEVADRIAEYAQLGLSHFVLSGYPHLEETYSFGEGVLPELARRGLRTPDAPTPSTASVPFAGPTSSSSASTTPTRVPASIGG
ncbi:alkanesulfonate monooxygenase [Dietzia sp. HMSC21D01]|uniref:LLM class flavin-dependent oxidoreductase n=1 Tax=Dietzia cinnamea TaxID=321318 RepID=A0AAW5Q962_9ACTN|nr:MULTISPECIES: LLM class flavin-dependent oxidoreductase [Dietzia]MCT1640912.1 LLM class flavin-dependent oxidoreductase [Dietzia cinnamea]MCT1865143.1 LLM class flavin-dependent oxidoreductase [Dietzia cinnamea]MCT1886034.1 LLM class flavin-dependent oxidoreductase [Dietzia cinnamea]MCT2030996.1 LLM class flavin-dependent oxidoreductase [Dietzia cinnamea]MCT2034512.1 LLM class flavin-dependent oxidoreductase [Dietzia cinnamea]